ncbi:hypothetical protein EVAR_41170_1 [Eumeta japonica]|uniref:Uncharacterized protein n=1 Tax=Eumeta variegata TaxID=151549 RepID=A0A4C1YDM3_EUMVA|nr:hypothetical protein EVAR_41170_1 [Eumeta japonica]
MIASTNVNLLILELVLHGDAPLVPLHVAGGGGSTDVGLVITPQKVTPLKSGVMSLTPLGDPLTVRSVFTEIGIQSIRLTRKMDSLHSNKQKTSCYGDFSTATIDWQLGYFNFCVQHELHMWRPQNNCDTYAKMTAIYRWRIRLHI